MANPRDSSSILAQLAARRSSYAFDREQPVAEGDQRALLEAARLAPSWKNREPWRLIVCDRFARPEAWQQLFTTLARAEQPWAYSVPLFVAVAVDFEGVEPEQRFRAAFDAGGAALQICLEAGARGLATQTTSAFDEARLRSCLGLPEQVSCVALVCVGHRADLGTLGRDVYRREIAPRARAALATRCFQGYWGKPFGS
jgi:nitroreductase